LSDCPAAEDDLRLLVEVEAVLPVKPTLCKAVLRAVCRRGLERLMEPIRHASAVLAAALVVRSELCDKPRITLFFPCPVKRYEDDPH
jgi:hypothetical protein